MCLCVQCVYLAKSLTHISSQYRPFARAHRSNTTTATHSTNEPHTHRRHLPRDMFSPLLRCTAMWSLRFSRNSPSTSVSGPCREQHTPHSLHTRQCTTQYTLPSAVLVHTGVWKIQGTMGLCLAVGKCNAHTSQRPVCGGRVLCQKELPVAVQNRT